MSSKNVTKTEQKSLKQPLSLALALIAFFIPVFFTFEGLPPEGHRVFSIFLLAIVLWVSEAIPLHATAALIIFLEILMISDKGIMSPIEGFSGPKYASIYASLANPILMLFLGGFFLADGAAKFKFDKNMARVLLKPFGSNPNKIMLGLMLITAVFSMFMSNTATTATMMAVVIPVLAGLPAGDRLRVSLVLCIPIAANVGGIGTPVGTPPNAIALGALSQAGYNISFVQWMLMAIPTMLVVLFFSWILLQKMYASSTKEISINIDSTFVKSRPAWIFYTTFALTVGLWLTEPLHGMKSTVVGFLPVVILLGTGVFTAKDLQKVQWHVLWLVAGGIALGVGVSCSGLDKWLVGLVSWGAIPPAMLTLALCVVTLAMSTAISNSATANLLVPIGLSLGASGVVDISPVLTGVFIAIGASLAMALPISTPPNAIAYSTGMVKTKDMATVGIIIGLVGVLLFVKVAPVLWHIMGVMPE